MKDGLAVSEMMMMHISAHSNLEETPDSWFYFKEATKKEKKELMI